MPPDNLTTEISAAQFTILQTDADMFSVLLVGALSLGSLLANSDSSQGNIKM